MHHRSSLAPSKYHRRPWEKQTLRLLEWPGACFHARLYPLRLRYTTYSLCLQSRLFRCSADRRLRNRIALWEDIATSLDYIRRLAYRPLWQRKRSPCSVGGWFRHHQSAGWNLFATVPHLSARIWGLHTGIGRLRTVRTCTRDSEACPRRLKNAD